MVQRFAEHSNWRLLAKSIVGSSQPFHFRTLVKTQDPGPKRQEVTLIMAIPIKWVSMGNPLQIEVLTETSLSEMGKCPVPCFVTGTPNLTQQHGGFTLVHELAKRQSLQV